MVEVEAQGGFELETVVSNLGHKARIDDSRSGALHDPLRKKEKYNS